jgi:UDP-N-acetylmuramoyl-tripeptide--D-alanyl-D-alanine ligase
MEIPRLYELFLSSKGVCIDSRLVEPGQLFVALKGRTDGNAYGLVALERGALASLVSDPALAGRAGCIYVADTLQTLQELARHHRRQCRARVFALTGSNGKTTTKELIATILATRYRVHATPGNYNNHIGVPLTLLSMPTDTEIAVVEMGANAQREIAGLCLIAEPEAGLITNIGFAHLEGFGGPEGVRKGKGELWDYLRTSGGMLFYLDNESPLKEMASDYGHVQVMHLGEDVAPGRGKALLYHPQLYMLFADREGHAFEVTSPLFGEHNARNVANAVNVGLYFDVPAARIAEAISAYVPSNNRSQIVEGPGWLMLLDAYNANLNSMKAALASFEQMSAEHYLVILGDMLELGEFAQSHHEAIGEILSRHPTWEVHLVGPHFGAMDHQPGWHWHSDGEAVCAALRHRNWEGYSFLIKGSRGMALERVVEVIRGQ